VAQFFVLFLKKGKRVCIKVSEVIIEAENISFSYAKKKVLDSISLKIEKGKFYGLLGPNGSGKTTLLDLLMGIKKPDKGKIFLYKKDLEKYKKSEIAKKISLVPQFFKTDLPYTVEEVLFMGRYPYMGKFPIPSSEDKKMVLEVMDLLGIKGFKNRYITNLSGGERQLVVFARAIVQDTSIIFLDEATSHLDIKHSLKILNLIREKVKKEGKTIISVFHDVNLASMYVDKMIFLKNGKLVKAGDLNEVLKKEILEEVFEVKCEIKKLSGYMYVIFYKEGI